MVRIGEMLSNKIHGYDPPPPKKKKQSDSGDESHVSPPPPPKKKSAKSFLNDEAEVSGDDSGDESLLEETESDKEFLDDRDNLSETSDIPPNPYLDKEELSLDQIEEVLFSQSDNLSETSDIPPNLYIDKEEVSLDQIEEVMQSPPVVMTQSQIPPTPEKTARKSSFQSNPQNFIDNNIFNCLSPLENSHQHPREIYAVMILKWTSDDSRPFSIVEKDFDIDFLASQSKPISGIYMTEFQECCFLVVQYSSKVYFKTFKNSLERIICRPLKAFYVNKGVKNGNLNKLNDLTQKCDTKSCTVGVVTFLGQDHLEDEGQMSSKSGQFNIGMLKDFAIEYEITVHDDLIVRYCRLRNPSVRGTVGSKKCNCGCGVPADVHEYHRVNASLFYQSAQSSTWAKTCSSEAQAHVHARLANTPISKVFAEWFVNYSPFKNRNVNEVFIEEHQDQLNMNFLPFASNPHMVKRGQPLKLACMAIHEVLKLFCSAVEQWKHRTLVLSGPSDSGKSTFGSVLLSILGPLDSVAISLEHKDDMFELGHTYKKHCILIEDALADSWEKMLTNLRNAFDGQIMTFNPKYGKTRSGIFGRSIVTTNMSREEVLAYVGNRRSEEIAKTGMRRFPTWIYLRQPPPFEGSNKYSLNKSDCEYLFHLNIQSLVKLLVNENDHDRIFKTVDGAQLFFEKMAILSTNDLISAFDVTGDSDNWPRNLRSLTFSNSASLCTPVN